MKDDAEGHARYRCDGADTVPHGNPLIAARLRHGPFARREDDALSLVNADGETARLRARPLLHEEQLAAFVVVAGPVQTENDLKRERDVAVNILVQAIVSSRRVR